MGTRSGYTDGREVEEELPPRKSVLREYTETLIICVLILIFPRTFVFQQSEIPSGSMEDTILIGDYILVNRFLFAPTASKLERALLPIRDVRHGDVLVFKHPQTPEVDYIKRVVGLPGDTVEIIDDYAYVNGQLVEEDYVGQTYHRRGIRFGPVEVQDDHYFVMGDHRNRSSDSRVWGQVPHHLIKGRAFMVLFSTYSEPDGTRPPGQVTPVSLVRKLVNLVFRARWDRAFTAIR